MITDYDDIVTDYDDIVYEVDVEEGAESEMIAMPSHSDTVKVPAMIQSTPTLAAMALAITEQPWNLQGTKSNAHIAPTNDINIIVERISSLLLIRTVALVSQRNALAENKRVPYSDLSTTTICKTALESKRHWPNPVSFNFIRQLRSFVRFICEQYHACNHYHGVEHCYHVVISSNKLLDMILHEEKVEHKNLVEGSERRESDFTTEKTRKTFGLKYDTIAHLALIFSAMAHDVDHKGVSNQQLVNESDDLAILYNDQSVAEQRALAVAFSGLRREEFKELREVWFQNDQEEYRRFRKTVVNLILTTDLASTERTQIVKSKWKEAFGDSAEYQERKQRGILSRRSIFAGLKAKPKSYGSSLTEMIEPPRSSTSRNPSHRQSGQLLSSISNSKQSTGSFNEESEWYSSSATSDDSGADSSIRRLETQSKANGSVFTIPSLKNENASNNTNSHQESKEYMDNLLRDSRDHPSRSSTGPTSGMSHSPVKLNRPDSLSTSSKPTPDLGNSTRQRFRLGIQCSIDVTGQQIKPYNSKSSVVSAASRRAIIHSDRSIIDSELLSREVAVDIVWDPDGYDELKSTVVLELIMKAADVSSHFQGWDQMVDWSSRLFCELKSSYQEQRGFDPQDGWFEGQISFLENYSLPLGNKLHQTGVFGEEAGSMFSCTLLENRDRWLVEGLSVMGKWEQIEMNGA